MRIKKRYLNLLALGAALILAVSAPVMAEEEAAASGITTNDIQGWPQGTDITSTAAVIMEAGTGTTLYAKNMDEALYPGSTVKVMTTLLAIETKPLTDQITMTETGVAGVTDGGASISSQLDEVFTLEQCLYAIMLASANDIALQVAEYAGGTVDHFVEMMNIRATQLGCTNTVFTNPTGLPDENQYTTAHDMALIMKAAAENETFTTIASAASYTIPATNVSGGVRNLTNNFALMNSTDASYYQYCLGGREGYTEASQSTLVCAAQKDDMTLVAVVLQGDSGTTASEAVSLLNYGFDNFQLLQLGEDDFYMVSGGTVCVPAGATEENLTTQDGEASEGQYTRQYYFGGTLVGTSVMATEEKQDTTAVEQGQQNLEAARQYSDSKTQIPYYAIGAAGVLLVLFLLTRVVKVAKS